MQQSPVYLEFFGMEGSVCRHSETVNWREYILDSLQRIGSKRNRGMAEKLQKYQSGRQRSRHQQGGVRSEAGGGQDVWKLNKADRRTPLIFSSFLFCLPGCVSLL